VQSVVLAHAGRDGWGVDGKENGTGAEVAAGDGGDVARKVGRGEGESVGDGVPPAGDGGDVFGAIGTGVGESDASVVDGGDVDVGKKDVGVGVGAGIGDGDGFGVGGADVGHAPPGAMLTVAAQLLPSIQLVPQNRHMRGAVSVVLTHWAHPT